MSVSLTVFKDILYIHQGLNFSSSPLIIYLSHRDRAGGTLIRCAPPRTLNMFGLIVNIIVTVSKCCLTCWRLCWTKCDVCRVKRYNGQHGWWSWWHLVKCRCINGRMCSMCSMLRTLNRSRQWTRVHARCQGECPDNLSTYAIPWAFNITNVIIKYLSSFDKNRKTSPDSNLAVGIWSESSVTYLGSPVIALFSSTNVTKDWMSSTFSQFDVHRDVPSF